MTEDHHTEQPVEAPATAFAPDEEWEIVSLPLRTPPDTRSARPLPQSENTTAAERQRRTTIADIHSNGGEKTFFIGQTPVEVVRCLMDLVVDRVIEAVPNPDPLARTYRLKD